jgi:hypothetical protein
VIADRDKQIFGAYGVEESLAGMFNGKVARDYASAMRAGYFSRPFGHHGGIKGHRPTSSSTARASSSTRTTARAMPIRSGSTRSSRSHAELGIPPVSATHR